MKLRNRVVVITGAAAGIGRASARRFAEAGATLHLVDRDAERLEAVALECGRLGARAAFHVADCRDLEANRRIAREVLDRDAVVDVLFLNAGIGCGGRVEDLSPDDWRDVLDVNLLGVVHGLDAFLPAMLAQRGGGHVILTASVLGLFAVPGVAAYAASKHALVGLGESLRAEVRHRGIEVTTLCPGLVATDIVRAAKLHSGRIDRKGIEAIWDTRGAPPDDVARTVIACVKHRRGGIRISASRGTANLWRLHRLSPRTYETAMAWVARGLDWLEARAQSREP
ncbi:MAG: SDR family NAD(P)-dependent oxidoreductase [Deltaproteobacteria bacterium]|nr:SDR family NAD(P)-dependent oxidoreductase [Deltaproteobacteria bacterium]